MALLLVFTSTEPSLLFVRSQCDSSQSSLPPDIPITSGRFCLLGCPIGTPSYCEEIVQARIKRIRESLAALHDMQDSQLETALLRSCLALPKFSYILRTSPPSYIEQAARDFDVAVRETFEVILGCPLSEWSWLKASLPSSHGGINLRSASLHAPAVFLASSSCSQELVGKMLGRVPSRSPHVGSAIAALANSTS